MEPGARPEELAELKGHQDLFHKFPFLKGGNFPSIIIFGPPGTGKTTLAQVVAVFYEKDMGIIKYNNELLEDIDKSSLRNSIFLVLQMPILFNNTLRFNIIMGNENINDDEIYIALEIAQFKDTVKGMKDGLDTIVGRHGIRLSGGQRQRISIARMIIADPKVVIFDESTSALDVHPFAEVTVT